MLWHLQRADLALEVLALAEERAPTSAEPPFFRGHVLVSKGLHREAAAAYSTAIARDPRNVLAHRNLGRTLFDLGELPGSIEHLREAVRLQPHYADAYADLGISLQAAGEPEGAIDAFRKCLLLRPGDPHTLSNLGNALYAKGDVPGAVAAHSAAIQGAPGLWEARYNLGVALLAQGEWAKAAEAFRIRLALGPKDPDTHKRLGDALIELEKFDEAIAEYEEALILKPGLAEARTNLGNAYAKSGRLDEAIREYERAMRDGPDLVEPQFNLAFAHEMKGDLAKAIEAYEAVTSRWPGNSGAHTNLGAALLAKGRADRALVAYQRAVELDPNDPAALCGLGLALGARGRFIEALPWLRSGHALGQTQGGWNQPSGAWVASTERQAAVEKRLVAVLAGTARAKDPAERIEFAEILRLQERFGEAARMYGDAFAGDTALANDTGRHLRYNAACCALRASAAEADAAPTWRSRALAWLEADLARRRADSGESATALRGWRQDPDLAPVRDSVGALPPEEWAGWVALWASLDQALAVLEGESK
jgi:tetratricopeptide (TPR) repeat protein